MWEILGFLAAMLIVLFLWVTSIAGTRYYEQELPLAGIKKLKWVIHLVSALLLSAIAYVSFAGLP